MGIREIDIAGKKLVIHELDDVCDSATGRALTGSWVWDSALVFSEWMSTQGRLLFDFRGKTVLELGAGAGLPGLTASQLGASRVILTDIEPLLSGLRRNVEANGLGNRVEVSQLVWGSDELLIQLSELDLVLMSDVFYDESEMAALAGTLKRVCWKDTVVWAACEVRPWTSECLNELVSEGFGVVEWPSQLGSLNSSSVTSMSSGVFAIFNLLPPNQSVLANQLTTARDNTIVEPYQNLD
ncbi:uncharacterized protein LOC132285006 [Cornus florida]|uniref:uncharacterized protein LOC132285006 n=1 Tax=Cornus florida TaxID=4283 RepID=UPI00289FC794|nr:uncharacterized protein LOC132285006 [Cornus florida]